MTTIPPRLRCPEFQDRLRHFLNIHHVIRIIIHIPKTYQDWKWEHENEWSLLYRQYPLFQHPRLFFHQETLDYGPATKWLGLVTCPEDLFPKDCWICIVDDDISYYPWMITSLWSICSSFPLDIQHSLCFVNHTIERTWQHWTYREWSGFAGVFGHQQMIRHMAQLFFSLTSSLSLCKKVDDSWLSFWFYHHLSSLYTLVPTNIDLPLLLDWQSTNDHPPWPELKHTSREIDTYHCLSSLSTFLETKKRIVV